MATGKRLIDANELFTTPVLRSRENGKPLTSLWAYVVDQIHNAPTVDAVEVIRCKDCQHSEPCKPYNKVWCPKIGRYMKADAFCSEGVKKDD